LKYQLARKRPICLCKLLKVFFLKGHPDPFIACDILFSNAGWLEETCELCKLREFRVSKSCIALTHTTTILACKICYYNNNIACNELVHTLIQCDLTNTKKWIRDEYVSMLVSSKFWWRYCFGELDAKWHSTNLF
jgi:hypothetical protein